MSSYRSEDDITKNINDKKICQSTIKANLSGDVHGSVYSSVVTPMKSIPSSDLKSTNRDNSSVTFCRICHDGETGEVLISPCDCSGSVGLVHQSCLEKWLSSAQFDTCELCKRHLRVSWHSRPLLHWLCDPRGSGEDQRNLRSDCCCLLLLTPPTLVSVLLCIQVTSFYIKNDKIAEAAGLVGLASVLGVVFLLWLVLTVRYHCQVWFKWRSNNQQIRLLELQTSSKKREAQGKRAAAEMSVSASQGRQTAVKMSGETSQGRLAAGEMSIPASQERLAEGEMAEHASCFMVSSNQLFSNISFGDEPKYSLQQFTEDTNHTTMDKHNLVSEEDMCPFPLYSPVIQEVQVRQTPPGVAESSPNVPVDNRVTKSTPAIPNFCPGPPLSPQVTTRPNPISSFTKLVFTSEESNIYEVVNPKSKGSFSPTVSGRNIWCGPLLPSLGSYKENSPRIPGSVFLPGLGQTLPSKNGVLESRD